MSTTKVLIAVLLALSATRSLSQAICPASVVGGIGIGDGCTTSYEGYNLAYIPEIGIFKGTFTPACDRHDKCYTTLGTSGQECNSSFLSDMQSACNSEFYPLLRPVEYQACNQSALAYRAAVDIWLSEKDPLRKAQSGALIVSRNLEGAVRSGSCATTPERTTLYSPALIAEINASFTTYAGRLPTIFEFLEAVNFGDVVYDVPGWRNNLQAFAASKFHAPKPPAVGYYLNGRALTATPIVQGATYSWVIDNLGTKDGSAMFVGVPATEIPKYDYTRYLRGYLKATLNKGTSLEISDVAIVETSIFIRGWCSSGPDQACR